MTKSRNTNRTAVVHAAEARTRLTMTVDEVAQALSISRNHAYKLVNEGAIPSKRLGRRYVVPRASLEAWLLERSR